MNILRKLRRQVFDRALWSISGNKRWGQSFRDWLNQGNAQGHYGDHWGDPQKELRLVLEKYLKSYMGQSKNVLEIGPGGVDGRNTCFPVTSYILWN